jgi:hypothetical protein
MNKTRILFKIFACLLQNWLKSQFQGRSSTFLIIL